MKFLDERIEFDFSNLGNTYDDSTYRYDILIDGELVFVGNVFVESTSTGPIIDVTDIVRNYFDTKVVYSSTPTKSPLIREVGVRLYSKDQSDEETITDKIMFIYRQQNYNSTVTTPINDDTTLTIPLLQGFFDNKLILPPTYPKVSEVLDFEFTGLYGNIPVIDSFNVNYTNDVDTNVIQVNKTADAGAFSYSVKLNDLVKGLERTEESFKSISGFLRTTDSYWRVGYPDGVLSANYVGALGGEINDIRIKYGSTPARLTPSYSSSGYTFSGEITTEAGGEFNSDTITVSFVEVEKPTTPGEIIYNPWVETRAEITFKVNQTLQEQFLSNGSYKLIYFGIYNKNTGDVKLQIELKATEIKFTTPCEAKDIEMVVFSPINPAVRYSYKIAKLDGNSRYFLKWRDRYGMPQIQPFKGTYNYKENISRSTVTNYKNTKKLTDVTVQGSWSLNTDYIPEKLYPFYESIFVSPWLQLYDAKEDKLYDVILVNTEYDEKTFNNQGRNLFNLQLEVELDTTQKIIY